MSQFFSQHNWVISPLPFLIVNVCRFSCPPSLRMRATTCWYHWLHRKYFSERSDYRCISSWSLLAWLRGVTFSSHFILSQWSCITPPVVYCCFCIIYLFTPRGWVIPLVGITDCIRSTFLRDHIIAIYHHFIHETCRINWAVSHYLAILYQRNGTISQSPWFIVVLTPYLFPPLRWVIPLIGISDYIVSTLLIDKIIARFNYYFCDPHRGDGAVSHYVEFLSQHNGTISQPPWFIVVLVLFIRLWLADGWVQPHVGITDYTESSFDQIYYCYILLFC